MQSAWLIVLSVGLAACHTPPPTLTPSPRSIPIATATPLPSLTPIPTLVPSPTATQFVPTRLPTRLPTRTLVLATRTPTLAPLALLVWDKRLDELGVKLVRATPTVGALYWRLIKAEFWDEKERQGKRHIFVDVLNENGTRIIGQEILVEWPGDRLVIVTENKPTPEYTANFPLDENHYPPWGTLGAFDVSVRGLPSDKVTGMGLPPKNKLVVFLLTFQKTIAR